MASYRRLLELLAAAAFVPGCIGDSGTIAGLVASGLVAFVLLIIIIAILALGVCWRQLFHEMQTSKGKRRVARVKKLTESQKSLTEVPMVDVTTAKNGGLHHFNPSRNTTLNKNSHADQWIHGLPPADAYQHVLEVDDDQDMVQAMDFESEEEPVIVTDVMDSGNTGNDNTEPLELRQTQTTNVFEINSMQAATTSSPPDIRSTHAALRTTLQDWRMTQNADTTEQGYVTTPPAVSTDLRKTQTELRNSNMRMSQVKASKRNPDVTASQYSNASGNDIIIKPLIPSSNQMRDMDDGEAMMVFDDDDEQGQIIPNWGKQQDVLF